jgi:hypothetical protein
MKRSTIVLFVHCFLLLLLVVSSGISFFLKALQPAFFKEVFFPTYIVLVLLTLLGWLPCLGGCFLTKWENTLRAQEMRPTYDETFIVHYIFLWTGRKVSKQIVTALLLGLMLLPVLVWFVG